PGFRKGKVPLTILKFHFGKAIEAEVKEKMLEEFYQQAIEKESLQVVGSPKFEEVSLREGEPFKFKVAVEVIPPAEIGEYKGIEVEVEKVEVTDEDVEAVVEMKKEELAQFQSTERPATKGDTILLDVTIEKDGKVLQTAREIKITLGEEILPAEVEKAIVGMKKGEEKKIGVKEEDLDYVVKLKDVQEKRLITLDESALKSLGGFKTVDELKDKIRKELEELARRREDDLLENKILEKIIENSKIEVPPTLLKNITEYYKMGASNIDDEKAKEIATQEVKKMLVIQEIAKKEGFEITDEELEKKRKQIIEEGTPQEKRKWLPEEKKEDLREHLLREKVIEFLKKNAKKKAKKKLILTPEEAKKLSQKKGAKKEAWKEEKGIIIPKE
ncbi:MAG: trigger factor, partial [Caldiserica bacterium]|nr:trigger factor [Caldisericota bacterium]